MNQKKSDDTSWKGQCYMNAINFMMTADEKTFEYSIDIDSLKVVHGIVTGGGEDNKGFRICHAWAEDDNFCYDHDAKTNMVIQIPKIQYYALGEIQTVNTKRYKPREIFKEVSKHNHAGPWDKKLLNHAINEEGSVYIPTEEEV